MAKSDISESHSEPATRYAANPVVHFYDSMGDHYLNWSPSLHIHFGYYRLGMNPFRLEAMLDQMVLEVYKRLNLCQKRPVLVDAGCGVGAASRLMSGLKPGAIFYGVTISPWQVAAGTAVNQKSGLDNTIFLLEADFQQMPFSHNFADAAFAIESACYARGKDKMELIKELARVLKPGGRMVTVDGFRKNDRPLPAFLEKIYRHYLDLWALSDLAELDQFRMALQQAGFDNIQTEDISWKVAPTALHIPLTVLKLWIKTRWVKRQKLSIVQKNYIKALSLTLFIGLWKQYFGYYMVTCDKK